MAYSYAQLEDLRVRVNQRLAAQQTELTTAKGQFTAIKNTLTGMGTEYGPWATEVEALATANPNDNAVKALKAAKDRIVAEFGSTQTKAAALETAVNAVA